MYSDNILYFYNKFFNNYKILLLEMNGFVTNIEDDTLKNINYRKIIYTDSQIQIALMTLYPNEDIPREKHKGSQFIRIESGSAEIIINGVLYTLHDGMIAVIPSNTWHYVRNVGAGLLQLYTIYSPPEHEPELVQYTPENTEF